MDKSNEQMLKVVEEYRTRIEDVAALKDKKEEYEAVVVRVKEGQKVTSEQLEDEMRRLSTELIVAADKLEELERIVEKYKSSGGSFESPAGDVADRKPELATDVEGRTATVEDLKVGFWNRPSRRLYLRPENTESLSLDLLGNVVRLPRLQQLQLRHQSSDSSNNASVEASSESMIPRRGNRVVCSGGDYQDKRRRRGKFPNGAITRKLFKEPLRNVTPFTKSLLNLATIFSKE
ncbi:uncharacterized protein LOC122397905 [Colletes gigas]|uniref:uncharacterized protein LOC122397905 n=1 Tax=Colletes gigas TaxID=935657 RepID=UPI001C9B6CF5|nr:uncharacterized protein LOC122397905 [Colletes gigas]